MKHKKLLVSILSFFLILTFNTGCKGATSTGSLKINITTNLNENTERTIIPEGATIDIVQYEITGQGSENDKKFSVTVNKPSYLIKGLEQGDWLINVIGKNKEGVDIAEGFELVKISNKPSSVRIVLNNLVGAGIISLNFSWDQTKIQNPTLQLELKGQNGYEKEEIPTIIDYENGRATFEKQIRSGSYVLYAKLLDGSTQITGGVEAIRVIPNKTSEGNIYFNIDNKEVDNDSSNPLIIKNKTGLPLPCKITNVPKKITLNKTIKPVLVAKDNTPLSGYNIIWYLDGDLIGSGENCSFTANLGEHRIDVVAENKDVIGGTSSSSFNFSVILDSPAYIPRCIKTIQKGDSDLNLGNNMQISFLNDGKLLLYCGDSQTLQIARIINNNLEVVKTYENRGTMPLTAVNDVQCCKTNNKVYITEQASKSTSIYDYSYNNLSRNYTNNDFDKLTSSPGNIFIREYDFFVDDPKSSNFRQYLLDPASMEDDKKYANCSAYNNNDNNFTCEQGEISPDKTSICRSSSTGHTSFSFICKDVENLRVIPYAIEGPKYSSNEKLCAAALYWNKFIIGSTNKIDLYKIPNGNLCDFEMKDSLTGGINGIPKFNRINDFVYLTKKSSHDSSKVIDKLYALSCSKNSILVFNADEDSDKLQYIGKEYLEDFIPTEGCISQNKEYLVVVSNSSKALKLFRINY